MAEAVDAIASTVRAGGTILVHGDYDVDGQCATALLTRALRAAGADVVGFVPHRLRDGYDFGPAGLAAAQAARRVARHHLRLRDHRGRHGARAPGPPASASSSPTTTCPGPSCRRRSRSSIRSAPDDTSGARDALRHRHRLQAGAGARARARPAAESAAITCSISSRSRRWPTSCRSTGENRILVRHGLRLLAESRWPGLRALVEAGGLGRPRDPRRPHGLHAGPAAQRGRPDRRRGRRPPAAADRRSGRGRRRWPAGSRG